MSFRVVPVLDLKEGRAVHAVGGHRHQYQALRSVWQSGPEPIPLARSLRDALGRDTLYLADLDAIGGAPPSVGIYRGLAALGLKLWIDAGLREARSTAPLLDLGLHDLTLIAGLETVKGPADLAGMVAAVGADRLIFSLDLFEGRALVAAESTWGTDNPLELVHQAIDLGVRRLLILDLARVGTGRGLGTEDLLARIGKAHPDVAILAGGGVARIEDVLYLQKAGAASVLVGSALHDGRIGRNELDWLDRVVHGG
ncbi:MAG TPA: HisA/HisF-related TIM barrel protein [Isosphaeraceae bacterium]|nr:HisA/HisF-related TIM barrel protein [Isosphaeraceae bacterium]